MPPKADPLDEQMYYDPNIIAGLPPGYLHPDNVLTYFMFSPFHDAASNNMDLYRRAEQAGDHKLLQSRKAFEEELMKYQNGIRYVLVGEPSEPSPTADQPYIIQKQEKRQNYSDSGNVTDSVELLATYYVIPPGQILMAPNLYDILQSRMLSITIHMQKFFKQAQDLYHWSPSTGYTWYPPNSEEATKAVATGSRSGSPGIGGDINSSQGPSQSTAAQQAAQLGTGESTQFEDDLLLQSLHLTNAYGSEYMDENPLIGEPGNFRFAATNERVNAQNRAQANAKDSSEVNVGTKGGTGAGARGLEGAGVGGIPAGSAVGAGVGAVSGDGVSAGVGTPKSPFPDSNSRKGSVAKVPKATSEKRRKSKVALSPTSPAGPTGS